MMNSKFYDAAVKYADDINDEYAENNDMGFSMDLTEIGPIVVKKYLELIGKSDTLDEKALKMICKMVAKIDYDYEQTVGDVLSNYIDVAIKEQE